MFRSKIFYDIDMPNMFLNEEFNINVHQLAKNAYYVWIDYYGFECVGRISTTSEVVETLEIPLLRFSFEREKHYDNIILEFKPMSFKELPDDIIQVRFYVDHQYDWNITLQDEKRGCECILIGNKQATMDKLANKKDIGQLNNLNVHYYG